MLFAEGDATNGIYFIYQGKIKVHKHWSEDKELILRFAADGKIVGHQGLGTSYETLLRMLNELIAAGIIAQQDKKFRVINEEMLKTLTH